MITAAGAARPGPSRRMHRTQPEHLNRVTDRRVTGRRSDPISPHLNLRPGHLHAAATHPTDHMMMMTCLSRISRGRRPAQPELRLPVRPMHHIRAALRRQQIHVPVHRRQPNPVTPSPQLREQLLRATKPIRIPQHLLHRRRLPRAPQPPPRRTLPPSRHAIRPTHACDNNRYQHAAAAKNLTTRSGRIPYLPTHRWRGRSTFGLPGGTVKSRTHYALHALRRPDRSSTTTPTSSARYPNRTGRLEPARRKCALLADFCRQRPATKTHARFSAYTSTSTAACGTSAVSR